MVDTFLTTGRAVPVVATANPQANVDQVSNVQPVQNNVGSTNNTQMTNNQVSPITIPIQIQPQVQGQPQVNNTQISENLQVGNQQSQNYNAPTPQNYNSNNTNNNVIDFNQIYDSYNKTMGRTTQSQDYGVSGIKKTSAGTTIVTPTVTNLNSVTGQYQSAYADTINGIISELLNSAQQIKNGDFGYDPSEDAALRMASEYAANTTMQSLAGSGVLNSSATAERVARIVSELIPQYEQKAFDRQVQYLNQLANTAQLVMNYDSQQFEYWKDAKDREFQNKQFEYQKQQDALENAWKRVDELGFVDNQASAILGVKVGTLSGTARQAKEQREFELAKMREQAEIEHQNNIALAKIKSELEIEQTKALNEYQYNFNKENGITSKSNSTTSLSTYKDIINNRFADYDEFSKKYTVSDNDSLYRYLLTEYSSGRMSESDFANLVAMYGVTVPNTSTNSTASNTSTMSFGYGSGGGFR